MQWRLRRVYLQTCHKFVCHSRFHIGVLRWFQTNELCCWKIRRIEYLSYGSFTKWLFWVIFLASKIKFFKAWFKDEPDIDDWPKYTLVKTSKDNSLENLSKSTVYQCPCLVGAGRGTPNYTNFHSWTTSILDVSSNEITHRTAACIDECTNEIIRDIMCTDSSGQAWKKHIKKFKLKLIHF